MNGPVGTFDNYSISRGNYFRTRDLLLAKQALYQTGLLAQFFSISFF